MSRSDGIGCAVEPAAAEAPSNCRFNLHVLCARAFLKVPEHALCAEPPAHHYFGFRPQTRPSLLARKKFRTDGIQDGRLSDYRLP